MVDANNCPRYANLRSFFQQLWFRTCNMELYKKCEIDAKQEKKEIDLHTLNTCSARRDVGHTT